MDELEESLAARIWGIQVTLDSLIFLFDHFRSDIYGKNDEPLSGVARILTGVQSEMDIIREKLDSL